MKKIKWFVPITMFVMGLVTPVFTSCGDDDDETIKIEEQDYMSSLEQKQKLEIVGVDLVEHFKAADFQNVYDLALYIEEEYVDYYEADAIEKWADNCLESITKFLKTEDDYYSYNYFKRIYAASNFTGHFEPKNGKWVYTAADDLQFSLKDEEGNNCVLKLTTSGKTQTVYVGEDEDWDNYWDDYEVDVYKEYLDVPEVLTLTLIQGKSTVAKVTINTDLKMMSNPDFDLNNDVYDVKATVTVNGYDWIVERAYFDGNSSANLSAKFKKDGKVLLSTSGSVDGDVSSEEAKNLNLRLDVMGEVQIQGACNDVMKLADILDKAEDEEENEGNFKSYTNQANELIDLGVYYGTSIKQAYIKLEPFEENDWGYYKYWESEPVIYFFDGSSYSTFEAFFNESSFNDFIDAVKDLINDYEKTYDM
ncbi:MAG: hypothetical protein IJ417_04320 [Bacteroidaceae bacterium]|nr:hypothetical protein [Bacteroidaceae bacterium]